MIWHDMLLDSRDERWAGYTVFGNEDYAQVVKKLPKDFVICDWQYGYPSADGKEPRWPTTRHFKKCGFDTISCPYLNTEGTLSLGRMVREIGGMGLLGTSWHVAVGSYLYRMFYYVALASWGSDTTKRFSTKMISHMALFASHVRTVTHDMGCKQYVEFGTARHQIHGPYFSD